MCCLFLAVGAVWRPSSRLMPQTAQSRLLRSCSETVCEVKLRVDSPPAYLRLAYFDPLGWRYRRQVLGFVGFSPIRLHYFGPVRRGGAERSLPRWQARITRAADRASTTRPRKRILG